jgi:hypothetical protein
VTESTEATVKAPPVGWNPCRRTCLHEAGHAVAVRHLLKQDSTPAIFDNVSGAAYYNGATEEINTTDEAIMIAAGKVAGFLAQQYPPPDLPPAPPLTTTYPEQTTVLLEDIKAPGMSDAVRLAKWAVRDVEDRPHRWARNYYLLMDKTELFVRDHQQEIVEVATELFTHGIFRLPAAPAGKE